MMPLHKFVEHLATELWMVSVVPCEEYNRGDGPETAPAIATLTIYVTAVTV